MTNKFAIIALSLALGLALPAAGQSPPPPLPTKDQLASDNRLFIEFATRLLKWDEAAEPIHIVGPLYFVGTQASARGCSPPARATSC